MENTKLYKIGEAAKIVGRSPQTISLWYDAVEAGIEVGAELPKPKYIGESRIRYFNQDDIEMIINFRNKVKRGTMAEFNRNFKWGKRGEDISKRIESGDATPKVYKEKEIKGEDKAE